jgi:hypothetical protein
VVIWVVSLLTPPPPQPIQDLVASVRYPKGTGRAPAPAGARPVPVH